MTDRQPCSAPAHGSFPVRTVAVTSAVVLALVLFGVAALSMGFGGAGSESERTQAKHGAADKNNQDASAPCDIVFVVDVSGRMNDYTEPVWATDALDRQFSARGRPAAGEEMMEALYEDLGFGTYPGLLEHLGAPLGVTAGEDAFAELTRDGGPLTRESAPAPYRIQPGDSLGVRGRKAYRWIIDFQIADVMPEAQPSARSSDAASYAYWKTYLDYLRASSSAASSRGQSAGVTGFNNPNRSMLQGAATRIPAGYRNKIGLQTYVNFLADHGGEVPPAKGRRALLSAENGWRRLHKEVTDAGVLQFPPRCQPMHGARRGLIAALHCIEQRNEGVQDARLRDRVSLICFDNSERRDGALQQALTTDYRRAMRRCAQLQAGGDKDTTAKAAAPKAAIALARNHLRSRSASNDGRVGTRQFIVLVSSGTPRLLAIVAKAEGGSSRGHEDVILPEAYEARLKAIVQEMLAAPNRQAARP